MTSVWVLCGRHRDDAIHVHRRSRRGVTLVRDMAGICAVVPVDQPGFRPTVYGMGIVIAPRIVVTCAHVVETALGPHWLADESPPMIRVSFPFAKGAVLEGTVSRDLWFPADRDDPK